MKHFLDNSVLVALYVEEQHTQKMKSFLQKHGETSHISRLIETEFYAALALKKRIGELSKIDHSTIITTFQKHINEQFFEMIYITDEVISMAIQILAEHKTSLKTLDALHTATCAITKIKMVTADQVLAKSAKTLGISCHFID